jgi:hypothetical protein
VIVNVGYLRIPIEAIKYGTTAHWWFKGILLNKHTDLQNIFQNLDATFFRASTLRPICLCLFEVAVGCIHAQPRKDALLARSTTLLCCCANLFSVSKDNYLLARQPGNAPTVAQLSRRRRKRREGASKAIKAECSKDKSFHEQQGQEDRQ